MPDDTAGTPAPAVIQRFRAAALQMRSTEDVDRNLAMARDLVARAAAAGASLITLPENFGFLRITADDPVEDVTADNPGPIVGFGLAAAREHGVWLLLGSIPERHPDPAKHHNTSVLVSPAGEIAAVYRKIHLFDVAIPGGAEFRESDRVAGGEDLVVADTGLGPIGLSVCYDLRFPEMYRELARRGARVLAVPAAFTLHTGKDHWIPLLRARAIENQAWVVAAAQFGHHGGKRHSYGKAVIIDPWGVVVACAPDGEATMAVAEIDYAAQDRVRQQLPALNHRRL